MNKIIQILIIGIFSYFVSPVSCYTQTIEFKIDSIFLEQDFQNSPGYAVLVAKGNNDIYRKAFGFANLEHKIKLSPNHIFRIGSITKQFTACAILKLEEEGKLSVEDNITKYIRTIQFKEIK